LFIYTVPIIGFSLSLQIRNQLHINSTKSNIKILHKNNVPKNSTIWVKNIDVQITILHIAKTRTSLAKEPVNGYLSLHKNNYFRLDVVVRFYTTLCLDGVCVCVWGYQKRICFILLCFFLQIFDSNIILRVFVDASFVWCELQWEIRKNIWMMH
jgi:hypothetical protein